MSVPFFIKSKLKLKNNSQDTYAATIENDTLTADSTVKLPNFATNTLASVNNAQTFTAAQTFQAVSDASVGAELITVAADRDMSGANNWSGTNWAVGGGTLNHTAGANTATLAGYPAVIGTIYKIEMTIVTSTIGEFNISFGGASSSTVGQVSGTLTTYTVVLTAASTAGLSVTPNGTWVGSIDNVSIMPVTISSTPLYIKNAAGIVGIEERAVNSTSFSIGTNALRSNTSGIDNTAIGANALRDNISGSYNNAIGSNTLSKNTTGSQNNAYCVGALANNTVGNYNNSIGVNSLGSNISGSYNNALGLSALYANTTGDYNNAIGAYVLSGNTTGTQNNGFGTSSLSSNTTGTNLTAVGVGALYSNTSGNYNNAIGAYALRSNTTADYNNAMGFNALGSNTTGTQNNAVGVSAAYSNTTGSYITAIGVNAGYYNVTGERNINIGCSAGTYNTNSNKLYIDSRDRGNAAGDDAGAIITGTMSATPASQTLALNAAVTTTYGLVSPHVNVINSAMFINSNTTLGAISLTYIVDTTSNTVDLTLPAIATGIRIIIKDSKDTFGTNRCRIIPSTGDKLDGYAANDTLDLDFNGAWIELQANSSNERWVLTTSAIPNATTVLTASKVVVTDASGYVATSSVAASDLPSKAAANTWAAAQVFNTSISSAEIRMTAPIVLSDNVSVTGKSGVQLSSNITVNGLSGGSVGQIIWITSTGGSGTITLVHNSGTGTQKFLLANGANVVIRPYGSVLAYCDGTYWFVTAI